MENKLRFDEGYIAKLNNKIPDTTDQFTVLSAPTKSVEWLSSPDRSAVAATESHSSPECSVPNTSAVSSEWLSASDFLPQNTSLINNQWKKLALIIKLLKTDNCNEILNEIVDLNIEASGENLRKLIDGLLNCVNKKNRLSMPISEIIAMYPVLSTSNVDIVDYKHQLGQAVARNLSIKVCDDKVRQGFVMFMDFVNMLLARKILNTSVVPEIVKSIQLQGNKKRVSYAIINIHVAYVQRNLRDSCRTEITQSNASTSKNATGLSQASNSKIDHDQFVKLHSILRKIDGHNHQSILAKMVALKIASSGENIIKITSMIVIVTRDVPALHQSACNILAEYPLQLKIDTVYFKSQLKISLMSQYNNKANLKFLSLKADENLTKLTKELHRDGVIDGVALQNILEKLQQDAKTSETAAVQTLVHFVREFVNIFPIDCLSHITDYLRRFLKNEHIQFGSEIKDVLNVIGEKFMDRNKEKSPENIGIFLLELPSKSFEEIKHLVMQAKTTVKIKDLAVAFYETAMTSGNLLLFARTSKIVEEHLSGLGFEGVFLEMLIDVINLSVTPMSEQETKTSKIVQNRVKFFGELYKVDCIDSNVLFEVLDTLSEFEALLELFHSLLSLVSVAIIKKDEAEKCKKYREVFIARIDEYKKTSLNDYSLCMEVIEILNNIESIGENNAKLFCRTIQLKISDLNCGTIHETARHLISNEATPMETDMIAKVVVSTASDVNPVSLAILSRHLVVIKPSFKQVLSSECQNALIKTFSRKIKLQDLMKAMNLLHFLAELFMLEVLTINFVALCSDMLCDSNCDNGIECLGFFLSQVGAKLEADYKYAIERIFMKIDRKIADDPDAYATDILLDLVEARENLWLLPVITSPSKPPELQNVLTMLENLTEDGIFVVADCAEIASKCEDSPMEMLQTFHYSVIQKPAKIELYGKLCCFLCDKSQVFQGRLKIFMKLFLMKFAPLKKEDYSNEIQTQLSNMACFFGHLFTLLVVQEEQIEVLIPLTNNLRFGLIEKFSSIIAGKVHECSNRRLKTLLTQLDETARNESKKFLDDIKQDLKDLVSFVPDEDAIGELEVQ